MIELVTAAATSANTIGSHSHPVLEEGNLSFPEGRYIVGFEGQQDGPSFNLVHQVEGAGLISDLLKQEKARYACIVSSPRSFFRKTHLADGSRQRVAWDDSDLGEPPLFTPVVLCTSDVEEIALSTRRHGVHKVWDGVPIGLRKGARLAVGDVFDLQSSMMQFIRIESDDRQEGNSFSVEPRSEPFGFVVRASPSLHRYLRSSPADPVRKNVMTHIVTACFAILQRQYRDEEEWDRNLKGLADHVAEKYPHRWDDDDFRPEAAATALYPLVLPESPA